MKREKKEIRISGAVPGMGECRDRARVTGFRLITRQWVETEDEEGGEEDQVIALTQSLAIDEDGNLRFTEYDEEGNICRRGRKFISWIDTEVLMFLVSRFAEKNSPFPETAEEYWSLEIRMDNGVEYRRIGALTDRCRVGLVNLSSFLRDHLPVGDLLAFGY